MNNYDTDFSYDNKGIKEKILIDNTSLIKIIKI